MKCISHKNKVNTSMGIFSVLLYTLSEKIAVFNYTQSLCFVIFIIFRRIILDRILTYIIQPEQERLQLLDFLKSKGFSRGILSSMKPDKSAIQLNGERGFGKSILRAGDFLRIHIPETDSSENILPVKMDLSILYEDEDILVINKEADMPVHPSIGNYDNTLANGVAWYFKEKGQSFVYRCINRLDRDTTGALILAKNPYSAAVLSAQMKHRQIRRTYLAIVQGITPKRGSIDAPIGRVADSTIESQVDFTNGDSAVTHYERLAAYRSLDGQTFSQISITDSQETSVSQKMTYSLIELHLETGRTHQIRVHMKHIGHPLPGDFLYNPDCRIIKRQPLHSYQLEFTHPVTGENMCITAPIPGDFADAFHHHKSI